LVSLHAKDSWFGHAQIITPGKQTEPAKSTAASNVVALCGCRGIGSLCQCQGLSDLEPLVLKQIDEFFINYQKVRDIEFMLKGHEGSERAEEILEQTR
jgi:hypothetical protein